MPVLNNGSADITLTKQSNTVLTLSTNGKYVDRNVQFNLSAQNVNATLSASASSEILSTAATGTGTNIAGTIGTKSTTEPTGLYFEVKSTGTGNYNVTTPGWVNSSATPASGTETAYYPVDEAVISTSGTNTVTPSASISGTNVTLSNTDNGISVTATGGGTASATATVSASDAGFITAGQIGSTTINASSQSTTASSFISGVTLTTPSSGTKSFSVTVPNGDSTVTFTFTVDASGNVVIE